MSDSALKDSNPTWHTVTVRIPFLTHKHATIAKQVIEVDAELQRHAVKRSLIVENEDLVATFTTLTVRLARLTINGFLENVDLVTRTIEHFGDEAESGPITTS
ncbi:transcription factor Pcc1-domain-containing protein [Hygrophoropsis aurantiaca]|uniref:Transcription factor Pcc1-domain-containing protein n=1 Tax=Hygrophoropsis aurantiaca TaxID=72124 RepID=A0ACB8AJM5_9AGAM|nr:transcription factor Pcc1-domain-containing protein [Hygrophoropsis aurantiaca]